jgi:hypothetical protein
MPAHQADWVAEHVLTKTYRTSCGGTKLIRLCPCRYGECGHCHTGTHHLCGTRRRTEVNRRPRAP